MPAGRTFLVPPADLARRASEVEALDCEQVEVEVTARLSSGSVLGSDMAEVWLGRGPVLVPAWRAAVTLQWEAGLVVVRADWEAVLQDWHCTHLVRAELQFRREGEEDWQTGARLVTNSSQLTGELELVDYCRPHTLRLLLTGPDRVEVTGELGVPAGQPGRLTPQPRHLTITTGRAGAVATWQQSVCRPRYQWRLLPLAACNTTVAGAERCWGRGRGRRGGGRGTATLTVDLGRLVPCGEYLLLARTVTRAGPGLTTAQQFRVEEGGVWPGSAWLPAVSHLLVTAGQETAVLQWAGQSCQPHYQLALQCQDCSAPSPALTSLLTTATPTAATRLTGLAPCTRYTLSLQPVGGTASSSHFWTGLQINIEFLIAILNYALDHAQLAS